MTRCVSTLLMLGLLGALPAHAQEPSAPNEAIARYQTARGHFESGRYPEAAAELEAAVALDPDSPTLAYNLARVYELMGELDRALEQYARYQTLLPQQQAREQERAEATIRRLQGARENQAPLEPPPAEVAPLMQLPGLVLVRENGVADAAFWITLTGGVAALGLGATFGGLALDARDRADGFELGPDGTLGQRDGLASQAESLGIVADATLGAGGLLVVTAGLLYFLRAHTVERAPIEAVEPRDEAEPSDPDSSAEPTMETTPSPSPTVDVGADGSGVFATVGGVF